MTFEEIVSVAPKSTVNTSLLLDMKILLEQQPIFRVHSELVRAIETSVAAAQPSYEPEHGPL